VAGDTRERRHPLGIVGSRNPADRLPLEDRLLTRDIAKGIHRIEDAYTKTGGALMTMDAGEGAS
jgi:hypothetical protein